MEVHHERDLDEGALNNWLRKFFKVSSLRFPAGAGHAQVIPALKVWKQRAALTRPAATNTGRCRKVPPLPPLGFFRRRAAFLISIPCTQNARTPFNF